VEKICCELCDEKFFIPANLDLHVQRNHQSASEDQPIICLFCSKLFKSNQTYSAHLSLFHKDEAIRCKYRQCLAVFRTEKSLKDHLTKKHFLSKPKYSVQCKLCKIWVSSDNYLKKHIEKMHSLKLKPFKCSFCPQSFDSKAKLINHIKKNHKEAKKCRFNYCQIYFKSKLEMENHFKNAHQINCKFCHSIFNRNSGYLIHLKQLHLEKKCKFSRCTFFADSKDEFENHLKEKHCPKLKKFLECVYCGKHYGESRGNFLTHIRKFHSKIAIQCEKGKCALFFKSQDHLEKHKKEAHKKIEKIKKTVECFYCQKVIWDKQCYAAHIKYNHSKEVVRCKYKHCFTFFKSEEDRKKHYGEKHVAKYCCALCDFSTWTRNNFRKHFERQHFPKEIKCPHCTKLFRSQQVLKEHINYIHKPHEKCPHCKEIGTNLNRHVVTTICPVCSQPFPCKKLFSNHKLKCKKIHKCLDCGKTFKHDAHLKYHINLMHKSGQKFKGLKCNICSTFFVSRKSLKSHQLSEHFALMKFKCNLCEDAFICKDTMLRHNVFKHNIGGFTCEMCDIKYHNKRELTAHIKNIHVEKQQLVECADCGKTMKKCSIRHHFIYKHFYK